MSIRRNSRLGVVTRDQSMPGVWTLWISIRDHPLWERYFCYDCRYIPNSSWAGMYGTIWSTGKKLLGSTDARFRSSTGSDKLRNFSVLPLENELGNMNMEPGKGGKSYWKSSFCTPRNHVWCPPARATTSVVSCAIWLISSAEETWSTWRFFGLRSMAFWSTMKILFNKDQYYHNSHVLTNKIQWSSFGIVFFVSWCSWCFMKWVGISTILMSTRAGLGPSTASVFRSLALCLCHESLLDFHQQANEPKGLRKKGWSLYRGF